MGGGLWWRVWVWVCDGGYGGGYGYGFVACLIKPSKIQITVMSKSVVAANISFVDNKTSSVCRYIIRPTIKYNALYLGNVCL